MGGPRIEPFKKGTPPTPILFYFTIQFYSKMKLFTKYQTSISSKLAELSAFLEIGQFRSNFQNLGPFLGSILFPYRCKIDHFPHSLFGVGTLKHFFVFFIGAPSRDFVGLQTSETTELTLLAQSVLFHNC
jgi:hypothetical protein